MSALPERDPWPLVRWSGIDRRGAAHGGMAEADPASIAEEKFRAGWRRLELRRGDEIVGEIHQHTGQRIWWAEGRHAVVASLSSDVEGGQHE